MSVAGWQLWRRAWIATALLVPALAFAADPQITSFIDTPDPVPAGGLYDYILRVDNNQADAATNAVLTLTVPAGATFVSATPAAANCVPQSATVVRCTLGSVGGSGLDPRDVTLRWRALGPGPATINASATVSADNDVNPANNTQTATTSVVSGANLAMAKTGTPNPVVGGANVTYTLTVSNSGPNASGDIVVTDNLPPAVSFVSASGTGWSCSHSAGVVTCSRAGPHGVGAAIPAVTLVGKVNAAGGTVTNSASVAPDTGGAPVADPDSANNTATFDTTVLPGADVNIAQKTVVSALPAVAGADVTFRIQPRNGGPAAASNVTVSDPLPAGWTFVSASGPNWACSATAGTVNCTRANMPTTATDDITVVARAPGNSAVGSGASYTNTASISSATADPDASNNSGSVSVTVLPDGADLRLAKSKTPNPVAQGSNMTSTIDVTNNGPRAATGPLRVVERLSGESFVSATSTGGWSCDASAPPLVVCTNTNLGGLAVNASLPTLSIVTRADVNGAASNTACTGGSVPPGASAALASPPLEGDPNSGNDCSTTTSNSTTVQPDLAITKTATTTSGDKILATSEATVTYTLVVSNVSLSSQAATGVRISDPVPAWIDGRSGFASITAVPSGGGTATFSCSGSASGLAQCDQSGGQLRQGESVTVTIVVNRPLRDGSFTNTASVSNTAEGDPNAANNQASDSITVLPIADVEMTGKTVTPASVRAGEIATYVLSFRNNGPSPALNVTVADSFTFPGGDSGVTVTQISSSAPGSTCTIAAGAVLNSASASFSCSIGTLANGQNESITLRVRPNFQPGNGPRSFTNLARIDTSSIENPAGGDNGNNEQNKALTVTGALVDLLVNKTDRVGALNLDPVPFVLNSTFMGYQVAVTNNGPSYATAVRVTENMVPPALRQVRFVCDVASFGSSTCNSPSLCSATNITSGVGSAIPSFTCAVPAGDASTGSAQGDLAVGATKNIYLRFEALLQPAPRGDVFNNTATASANEPDSQAANDSEGEQTTVRQRVNLATTKTSSVASPALRQPFNWSIRVTNGGPGNSLQTDLTDTLPAEVEVTGPITWTRTQLPASGTCTLTGRNVACALGQLDAGGAADITVPARIVSFPAGGTITNTATVDTDPDKTGGIDTPGGNNTGSVTLTVQRSSIAGTVFEDRDRSGANGGTPQAAGTEPRISGATVTLTGTDAYGNAVNLTAITDSDGNYLFNDLSPSDGSGYTVSETQPAGFINGTTAPPASGAGSPSAGGSYAGGGTSGNSSYGAVVLAVGTAATNYNFPEIRRPTLSGNVYVDANANGVRNAGTDPAVAGATVRLLNAGTGAVIGSTLTAADGSYSFANLDPLIAYTVEEPLPASPAGLVNGPVNPGLVNGVACASGCTAQPNNPTAGTDRIAAIDLSSGADGTAFDFGEIQQTFVAGLVWVDRNRDGVLDPAESTRLAGVTLRLVQGADCTSGTTLQTTATASDGTYRFDNVRAYLDYLVCETQPAAYGSGTANGVAGNVATITALAPTGSPNNNFGETPGSIAGSVYQDTGNGVPAQFDNGVRDSGEPGIAGVTVTLSGTDVFGSPVSLTTTTDASGNWLFDGLLPPNAGGYTVTEGAIPGSAGNFLDGKDRAGTAGGNAAVVNDQVSVIALAAGQQATGYLFGELPNTSISGTVYLDRNRNGTPETTPTDGRLPGVTIRLVQGADCASGTVLQTTTTDSSGNYSFNNVAAGGSYLICETQPAGYANGTDIPGAAGATAGSNAIRITNLPSTGSNGNQFGETAAALAGSVWLDYSPATPANTDNGQRDAGETGIAGVPVTLNGRDIAGNPVSLSTVTDLNGNWRFDDLLQSDVAGYTVTEGAIPGSAGSFNDGREHLGTAGGSTAVNDSFGAIVLAAGSVGTGYDFGELPIAPITGTVYIDRDRNGTLGAGDGGLGGVTIRLVLGSTCGGTVVATTTTDASGNYAFSGVSAGLTYTLCESQPVTYADGSTNPGGSGSSAVANAITLTNLPAGGSAGNHFGERASTLAGSVYLDASNDGIRQGSEAGIAGVTVSLSGIDAAGNSVSRTATTDASGNYSFIDLPAAGPAGYTVTEQAAQPVLGGITTLNGRTSAGTIGSTVSGSGSAVGSTPSSITGIALPAGADSIGNRFGEVLPASISGTVFVDANNNGLQNLPGDLGLGGVAITITGTDDTGAPVTINLTTAADGSYNATGLRPGTYTITEPQQPAGTTNGLTIAGSPSGSVTPPATTPSAISGVVLGSGTNSTANNFAELANNSSISGRVWLDVNNDGVLAAGEAGIAGVTIELSGTDLAGRNVALTTITGADGTYRFDQLAPGSYTLREPSQPPATVNGSTLAGSAGGTASAPASTPSTVGGIVLGIGASSTANNFGEVPAASIAGSVWADNNDNGRIDAGETGLAGVTIVLSGTDDLGQPVNLSTTSAADGSYAFGDLRPGRYTLTEPTQPAGTVSGQTAPGSLGGIASGPAVVPSFVSGIVLPPGGASVANNFGELANSPDLRVSKSLVGTVFTAGFPGSYRLTVRNAGEVASSGVYTVSDRLPAGLTLAATPTGSGWACTGAAGASVFSCTSSAVVAAGATNANAITATVNVSAAAAAAGSVNNAAMVEGGGEIPARGPSAAERDAFNGNAAALPVCTAAIGHNACRTPTPVQLPASISGTVWQDLGPASRLLDAGDRRLPGWLVEVVDVATGGIVGRATTGADGSYRVDGLLPGSPLAVRFRDPASGVVFGYPVNGETAPGSSGASCQATPAAGQASSCVGSGASPALTVVLKAGENLPQQSLPVDPSGVVYDSGLRQPVPGSIVTLAPVGACPGWDPATGLVGGNLGGYTVNGGAVSMTVGADGFYQYLFAPAAPGRCTWGLTVTPPAGYSFQSSAIPPTAGPLVPPGGATSTYAVQPQAGAPTGAIGTPTSYFLQFTTGSGGANVVHNHIPLDPALPAAIALAKTGDKAVAEVGDTVRYSITVSVATGALPRQTTVVDRLPAGFTYIRGTAMVGDVSIADPQGGVGPILAFNLGAMPASRQLVLHYRVRVGVGAQQGDGINRARAHACGVPAGCVNATFAPLAGSVATNEGSHRVRVGGGVFTTDACVLGKIFVDCNHNHVQDPEEIGIPGVRLFMQDGTTLVSDSEGKYSVCGLPPRSAVLKVDPITLPLGSRLTTSSNRNLGDAGSLWLDLKNGELHRADFVEGSCSNTVLEQVKARRAQGEVRAPENERKRPALRFESKPPSSPQQGTDGANQTVPKARPTTNNTPGASDAAR